MKKRNTCPLCRIKLKIKNLNKYFSLNVLNNSVYQSKLLHINLRNLWEIQQILNPSYESISYNSLYETHINNYYDHSGGYYFSSNYSWSNNDNDNDKYFNSLFILLFSMLLFFILKMSLLLILFVLLNVDFWFFSCDFW